ncbi:MAG TPA: hypothetical protein VKY85_21085 [Candidatus Angelobacter sp.]|nr:hypothetical protein [Candidatus Angelobacter sp.]
MYLYHAHAVALGGTIERPDSQTIEGVAGCVLPLSGGTSSASSGKFDNGLVAFDSAQSQLTGSVETRNGQLVHVTGVSTVINGLNIRNMFMADQVVVRIASEHSPRPPMPSPPAGTPVPPLDEPSIITTGCHFDNLKIAGHQVTVDMDHKVFVDFPTYGDCQRAWSGSDRGRLEPRLLGSTMPPPGATDPQHLREIYQGFDLQSKSATLRPNVLCSFVQNVKGINGAEIDNWGPIIRIPQFGTMYLGEVLISPGYRGVNMFRLQLGSPDGAGVVGGGGGSNGTGFP